MAAFLLLSLCLDDAGLISSAQKNPQQKPRPSARTKAAPTPTPSATDALGAPPPVPTLKKQPEQEVTPGDVISVMTTEVLLPVTVRDSSGRLVKDLTRNDFRVYEDGSQQPVNDLALREVPVDAVLMVDASSSVATNIDDFRRAAEGFAARLNEDDRISLIKFDDRVELLQDWTRSRFQLRRALARIEPGMFTRFNDALLLASREQFGDTKSRRAVIVLTDGIDSGRGTTTLAGALEALLRAQATIYVVSNTEISRAAKRAELDNLLNGSSSTVRFNQIRIDDLKEGLKVLDQSEKNLEQLADATGGRLYKPLTFQALDSTYAEVADELRHQYGLYYPPLNKTRDGGFRRVRVELTNPAYKAHTRVGYFAPAR
ncbi:MAG TPA: VWA domain-containing protein [Pyrinomonadaceae bacterium]|nr:VWA domain-containing protein [Pyrinomonadaceae bacterium]